jgi:hypothetical protein
MAQQGEEYEKFVYEKLKRFFPDFEVTHDDQIEGKQSGLHRQIDISIRGKVRNIDLLYIVQCKDYKNHPADITTLGEFSAVIKDVQASKGFLVCTSGFAKSNHPYAKALGIELLTIEDINSDRWKAEIEIPIIFVKNAVSFTISIGIIPNEEFAQKNKVPINVSLQDLTTFSLDGGKSPIELGKYVDSKIKEASFDVFGGIPLSLDDPNLMINIAGVWTKVEEFTMHFTTAKSYYLKFVEPDEYSHIKDHLADTVLPLHFRLKGTLGNLDESYTEIDKNDIPVFTNISIEIEEKPASFEGITLTSMKLEG